MRSIKIKKNLGQIVTNITNSSLDGFTIKYGEGDICDHGTEEHYTSQINFVCKNDTDDIGWPIFKAKEGKCHYVFEWQSLYACSQCTDKQIKTVVSTCNSGERTYVNIPMEQCIIEQTDGEYFNVYE